MRYALEDVVFLAEAIQKELGKRSFDSRLVDDYVLSFPEKLSKSKSKSKAKKSTFEFRDDDDKDNKFLHVRAPISKQQREDQEKASAASGVDNPWIMKQRKEMDAIDAAEAAAAAATATAAVKIPTQSTTTRQLPKR